jgi:hypothetical protein
LHDTNRCNSFRKLKDQIDDLHRHRSELLPTNCAKDDIEAWVLVFSDIGVEAADMGDVFCKCDDCRASGHYSEISKIIHDGRANKDEDEDEE